MVAALAEGIYGSGNGVAAEWKKMIVDGNGSSIDSPPPLPPVGMTMMLLGGGGEAADHQKLEPKTKLDTPKMDC